MITRRQLLRSSALGVASALVLPQWPSVAAPTSDPYRLDGPATVIGPRVWTDTGLLRQTLARLSEQREPYWTAWTAVLNNADIAMDKTYDPVTDEGHVMYYNVGRLHAQDARDCALAFQFGGRGGHINKAREIIMQWARDPNPLPGANGNDITSQGMVLGRVLSIFCDAFCLAYARFSDSDVSLVRDWLARMEGQIDICRQEWIFERPNSFSNHVGAMTLGTTTIGFALENELIIRYGLEGATNPWNAKRLINGAICIENEDLSSNDPSISPPPNEIFPAVSPGELWDRARIVEQDGLVYAMLHLRLLVLLAEASRTNGDIDLYRHSGPNGEEISKALNFYAEFLVTKDPGARTGYYESDTYGASRIDLNMIPIFEIAVLRYPANAWMRKVLVTNDRRTRDLQMFGDSMLVTHGADLTQWEFTREGDSEGWRVRKSLTASVSAGKLHLQITGADPGLLSPPWLGSRALDYRYLTMVLLNDTPDDRAQVYFTTNNDPNFDSTKSLEVILQPDDDQFRRYTVDMASHPDWNGTVRELRIDPVKDGSSGGVSILDAIRLTTAPPSG